MTKRKNRVPATVIVITNVVFGVVSTNAAAGPGSNQGGVESAETSAKAAGETRLTYAELEAQIRTYQQDHAEEDLLTCLREAKSDPKIRGTHIVGPRLKQLKVKQRRYADFRDGTSGLTPEDKRQVEIRIIELHMEQKEHIEFTRGLFENGHATTNNALLEYHDTGCIAGLENVVEDIRNEREGTAQPATP